MKFLHSNISCHDQWRKRLYLIAKYLPLFSLLLISFLANAQAQTTVIGVVRDAVFHAAVPGAVITEEYSNKQTTTDATGAFQLKMPTNTTLTITIDHVGFQAVSLPVFASKRIVDIGEIELQSTDLNFLEIYNLSNRAFRGSPVTRSSLDMGDLSSVKGSMQLPYSLQNIAGLYTSQLGNTFGRSRLNIRGFEQQHISVMVNGVTLNNPVNNDFNWAGRNSFQEMFSSIQVQKGTNNNMQYSPFGGGSLQILTKPASQQAGGKIGFEYGEGNFMRSSATLHSGLLKDKIAFTLGGTRMTSDGIINGTWTDAWTYYFSTVYAASEKHRFELYAMGSPQRHGQALSMQHVAAYSHEFAGELGVPEAVLDAIPMSTEGRLFNQGISFVDADYAGQQFWNGKLHERFAPDFLNEHEHYSHDPFVQFNWYADWSPKISQQTMVYYDGLMEGNTGVSGDVNLDYTGPAPFIDYSSTIAENRYKVASEGILNNAVRNQLTLGTMSRVSFQFTEQFSSTLGFNLKNSDITEYQEVRDLLGGSYFIFSGNPFDALDRYEKDAGDIIGYHHTSQLRALDFFSNLQFTGRKIAAFMNGAYSLADQTYTDRMQEDPDQPGRKYRLTPGITPGYQLKAGLSYRPVEQLLLYGNYSYISREPDRRLVVNFLEQSVNEPPENMIFRGFDGGARFIIIPSTRIEINYYNYTMVNNTMIQSVTDRLSNTYLLHVTDIGQLHSGVEFEAGFRPARFIGIEATAALGNWTYSNDATGTLFPSDGTADETNTTYTFGNKGLHSGNAPQLQLGATLTLNPFLNSYVQASFHFFSDHFAAWNPAGDLAMASGQLWEIPEYYLIDLHAGYTIVTNARFRIALKGHVFNLLDELYVQDALNNGALNMPGVLQEYVNSASSARVYIGLPRTYSAGLQISF